MLKNVVLISLDTLRADVAYSGRFAAIESLRRRGTSFLTTVASSPLTPISHASIFTGMQPPAHGIRHLLKEQLSAGVPTIAEVLRAAGYTTGAVVSCPGMNKWYGLDRGFSSYDDWIPPLADGRDALEVIDVKERGSALKRAPDVVARVVDWARTAGPGPKLLLAHFFDAHWPYESPVAPPPDIPNPYEGEVWFMDRNLGELLDGLATAGMTVDNTVFVLFSDHGEDLAGWYPNDHAGEHGHPEEQGHGCLLFDATQLVPFVVVADGVMPADVAVTEQVRLVDIMPTVLDIVGVTSPAVDGQSLRRLPEGGPILEIPAYCEAFYREELAAMDPTWSHIRPLRGTRTPSSKLIWTVGADRLELFDLRRDPLETSPTVLVR